MTTIVPLLAGPSYNGGSDDEALCHTPIASTAKDTLQHCCMMLGAQAYITILKDISNSAVGETAWQWMEVQPCPCNDLMPFEHQLGMNSTSSQREHEKRHTSLQGVMFGLQAGEEEVGQYLETEEGPHMEQAAHLLQQLLNDCANTITSCAAQPIAASRLSLAMLEPLSRLVAPLLVCLQDKPAEAQVLVNL